VIVHTFQLSKDICYLVVEKNGMCSAESRSHQREWRGQQAVCDVFGDGGHITSLVPYLSYLNLTPIGAVDLWKHTKKQVYIG